MPLALEIASLHNPNSLLSGRPCETSKSIRSVLALGGEILLYICFAAPFAIDKSSAILSIAEPYQAQIFGTIQPYYTLYQLLALVVGLALFILKPYRTIVANCTFIVYTLVNVIGIAVLVLLALSGNHVYWDYALEFLRLFSLVILAETVIEFHGFNPIILVRCMLILLIIPIAYLAFSDPSGFLYARGGRVNGPGLELTSTGHVAAIALLLGWLVPLPNRYKISLVILSVIVLLLSGARIPFVLVVMICAVKMFCLTKLSIKKVILFISVIGIVSFALWLNKADLIVGGRIGSIANGKSNIMEEYTVGRGIAVIDSKEMLSRHPYGYIDSDWSIQEELVLLGFPSHTHSNYVQSYLRFGPLALVFWGVLIWRAHKGSRRKSPYATCLWFIVLGSIFDYNGCITKVMLILFIFSAFNEAYIRSSSNISLERSCISI